MKLYYAVLALAMLAQAAFAVKFETYLAVDCTGPYMEVSTELA